MAKVFLSWSGRASREVATALYKWLPVMLNSIEPFISTEDLRKGGRWASELAQELEQATFAVLCVTPQNLQAPWLMFEAGAVSKLIARSQVAPFLFETKPSDLQGPLAQFNAALNEKEDFHKLLKAINGSSSPQVREEILARSLDVGWQSLQADLQAIKPEPKNTTATHSVASRPDQDVASTIDPILQEILSHSRQQSQILNSAQFTSAMEKGRTRTNADLPAKGHKVWEDLVILFEEVVGESILLEPSDQQLDVLKAIEKLAGPIDYILSKTFDERLSQRGFHDMVSHLREITVQREDMQRRKRELAEQSKPVTR